MPDPNLPNIQNIPPSEFLAISRGKIMDNYGALSAGATTVSAGLVEIATMAEIFAGTDACRAVTPSGLISYVGATSANWVIPPAFLELSDVVSGTGYAGKDTYVPTVSSGQLVLAPQDVDLDVFNVCYEHDLATIDTDFLLPDSSNEPDATVVIIKSGTSTVVTLTPQGLDQIMSQGTQYISSNSDDEFSVIVLRLIGNNWVIVSGVGEWRLLQGSDSVPGNQVEAEARYCTNVDGGGVGGGGAVRYIGITGTGGSPALTQTRTTAGSATYVYDLSDWEGGAGLDAEQINGVYVYCRVVLDTGADNDHNMKNEIVAVYPDGTERAVLGTATGENQDSDDDTGTLGTFFVPVNIGQTTFTLKFNMEDASDGSIMNYTIVGVQQPVGQTMINNGAESIVAQLSAATGVASPQTNSNVAWSTAELNSLDDPHSIATLGSNQITLPTGTYNIRASGSSSANGAITRLRFRNISDSVTEFQGTQVYNGSTTNSMDLKGSLNVQAGPKTYELQVRSNIANSFANCPVINSGDPEIYTTLEVTPLNIANPIGAISITEQVGSGDAAAAGAIGWNTRALNTKIDSTSLVNLSSNQFTLPPGTYSITAFGSLDNTGNNNHKVALYNVTDASYDVIGYGAYNELGRSANASNLVGVLILSTAKVFELRHYLQAVAALGIPIAASGEDEVYSAVNIVKLN
jgi:hypothetical protein